LACRPAAEGEKDKEQVLRFTVIDAFRIPILATADEQLAHARSDFEEVHEKKAALKAVAALHPTARRHAAMAALELAYLELGPDYRLADSRQCSLAMEQYRDILDTFSDLPEVAAKSLWYQGWIASDLLGDRRCGLTYYQRIIDQYPNESLHFLPPAPWLTIHRTEESVEHRLSYSNPGLTWADVAYLEIIRYATEQERAWAALLAIRANHGNDGFAGIALKVFLTGHDFEERSEQLTRSYLAQSSADQAIKDDLQLVLSAHLGDAESSKETLR